jgi:hypothetical protein
MCFDMINKVIMNSFIHLSEQLIKVKIYKRKPFSQALDPYSVPNYIVRIQKPLQLVVAT